MACDGIYDCVTNEELTKWFSNSLQEYKSNKFTYTSKKLLDDIKDKEIALKNNSNNQELVKELDELKKQQNSKID